ncbi:hypothetical protein HBI40_246280 [Parastagonospora nodorum]|nr:hypothetical protein HBI06_257850 [Parastagonospora nodorum]KAH5388937.1 hypothetical protein HBI32_256020 [Parastagonospora nodorum]KAH6259686.1 hypothetical protein HBI40_246280 [Parastagonospora nodorum]
MKTREALLNSFKGTQLIIPNLYEIFADWPHGEVNPNYPRLIQASAEWLESVVDNKRKLNALQTSDFAFFAATWWPKAGYEELKVLLFLAIWLFIWDDEVDEPAGAYSGDLASAEQYRTQTIDFVLECLGLRSSSRGVPVEPANKIITSFRDIGEQLAKDFSRDQRQRFMGEMIRFLEQTKREQQTRLSGNVPGLEEYWSYRMGTSAVGVIVAALEYAMRVRLGESVVSRDGRIQTITAETIRNIVIVNDLLSLKKEIAKKCVESMIPISCAHGMSAQSAVNEAIAQLKASRDRFTVAADALRASIQQDPIEYKHVSEWIHGCQNLCMGNVTWSLATGRYGLSKDIVPNDGSIQIVL